MKIPHRPTRGRRVAIFGALAASILVLASVAGARHPQIKVGGFPTGIAVDSATGTVYVGNGTTDTLSLIDGARCNARDTAGCGQHVAAVTAGADPIGVAVEESTNTVYVVNASGALAVVNGRRCNAANRSGCREQPASVRVGKFPQFLAVDEKTHTIYVANGVSNSLSVIDGRRCNAVSTAGCRRPRATIPIGPGPFALVVNELTDSVYVTNLGAPTLSVIDTRHCNAADVSGCGQAPATVNVGEMPGGIAIDTRTNTIYVTGESSNDVSVIDGRTCNGRDRAGLPSQAVSHARRARGPRDRGRRADRDGIRGEHGCGHGQRDRRRNLQRHGSLGLWPPGRHGTRRLEPPPDRGRRGDEHGLCHERLLEHGDDARRPRLFEPRPYRLPVGARRQEGRLESRPKKPKIFRSLGPQGERFPAIRN